MSANSKMNPYQYNNNNNNNNNNESMSSVKQLTKNTITWLNSNFRKLIKFQTLCVLLCGLICFTTYVAYVSVSYENTSAKVSDNLEPALVNRKEYNSHVLCVLVPFRDRFDELLEFIPHISKFLNRQSIKFHIAILNHIPEGGYRYNQGATNNAGFHIISKKFPECDYIALHDVDTLPLAEEVSYAHPGDAVYHGIPQGFHPEAGYNHPFYISGILLIPNEIFIRVNGFGNNFWGWGAEDVNFYHRLAKYSVKINRPKILSTDATNSFKHIHGPTKVRDVMWCSDQKNNPALLLRVDDTGLSDVDFTVTAENELILNGFPVSVFNIIIKCNFEKTPWCKPFCQETPPKRIEDYIYEHMKSQVEKDRINRETMEKISKMFRNIFP